VFHQANREAIAENLSGLLGALQDQFGLPLTWGDLSPGYHAISQRQCPARVAKAAERIGARHQLKTGPSRSLVAAHPEIRTCDLSQYLIDL